jgi:hypothetical protein
MNAEYFRRFAYQCRELLDRARSDAAREQLRLWAEEFEAQAALLEGQRSSGSPNVADTC